MKELTAEQAQFIKDLRIHQEFTWRSVANAFREKYPDFGIRYESSIDGANLCEQAMKLLEEEVEDGWN